MPTPGNHHRGGGSIVDTSNSQDSRSDQLDRARTGFDLVESDPQRAEVLLNDVLLDAGSGELARAIAYRGIGRLLTHKGEMDEANRVFRLGVDIAERAELATQAALTRVSWASARQAAGDNVEALALLEIAEPVLGGGDLGLLISQRGLLHWTQGQAQLALEEYDVAIPMLREAGDDHGLVRVLGNRGIVLHFLGRVDAARTDLEEQLALARLHDRPQLAAAALHSLGWLEGRLGNLPAALRLLQQARDAYMSVGAFGRSLTSLDTDHCEVLLQAMLAPEADELALRVVLDAERSGNAVQVAEARLMRARSLLLMRRFDQSVEEAQRAHEMFTSSDRLAWAARASYFIEQARVSMPSKPTPPDNAATERLAAIADALDSFGWIVEAAEVRVHAGRTALDAGLPDLARQQLTLTAEARHRGIAAVRAEAWHATAMLRLADGDRSGARRAIAAGLRALHRHRATLGAMELRAHASAHGVELGRLGLRLALREGTAANVLVWAERWRAGSFALAAARSTSIVRADAETETALADLRELHARSRTVSAEGIADPALTAQLRAAERTVSRAARLTAGQAAGVAKRIGVPGLRAALSHRSLVELVELDGRLHAVVVTARRTRLVELGETGAVMEAHDHLLFALRRVSMLPNEHPGLANAQRALDAARAEVDELLLAPLELDGDPVVIVPTGDLHRLVWSTLPSLSERAVTIAPSAGWWLAGHRRADSYQATTTLLIEGPDLAGTSAELEAIAGLMPGAVALLGAEATVSRCLEQLPRAEIAHVAAHGTFRSDNPMFSSLRVADGEIWVHDLARLSGTPDLVILTACDAGRSGVMAGDELLGTATALLSIGVQTVIAPLLPVPDDATARFGVRLHQHLVAGASPEQARANAAAEERATGEPAAIAVAAAFHCIGTRHASAPLRHPKNP